MNLLKKITINFLIIFYLGVIYFSGVPETNTLTFRAKQKAESVAFVVGIWPSWSMFAPNPIKFDSKTYVEIVYKNGEKRKEDVEIKLTGLLATFRKARWMKYSQDNLRSPDQRGLLWPALRHFRAKFEKAGNPIVSMNINRYWIDVPPFNEKGLSPILDPVKKATGMEILMAENYKE
jgi:hypothetical protein